ncbi:hypothetical protein GQ600_14254 [Phytophthora cactorum]|nr:hypothetical protein GQ600_14254 [Phytophthora cactorum]
MQWIGRQCAHLFAQLDCKETEATVVALLLKEEITQIDSLRDRVSEIVYVPGQQPYLIAQTNQMNGEYRNVLEKLCHQWGDKKGDALPQLLSIHKLEVGLEHGQAIARNCRSTAVFAADGDVESALCIHASCKLPHEALVSPHQVLCVVCRRHHGLADDSKRVLVNRNAAHERHSVTREALSDKLMNVARQVHVVVSFFKI